MGQWAWAQPQKARGPGDGLRAVCGWARARAQWPITWVLCPMALSYVLWRCPISYGPVLCPMAMSYVLWAWLFWGSRRAA